MKRTRSDGNTEREREAVERRKTFEKWPLMMNFLLAAIYDNGDASADMQPRPRE